MRNSVAEEPPTLFGIPLGLHVMESVHLTQTEEREVKRSWRERLLSWPWCPWRSHKTISVEVPDPNFYMIGGHTVVCHPAMRLKIEHELNALRQHLYRA
jgi:hypothetical protein